ncbi:tyrosine-type recombinase/integrase [Collimonas arenae]|nr:site-specific integrase [Collimonas arenae]
MASIQKVNTSWKAQIAILGHRESKSFKSKREAESWAARRETEMRSAKNTPQASKYTLLDAFQKYAKEVSPEKDGERWEVLRLKAFERHKLPLMKPIGEVTPDDMTEWRIDRLTVVKPGTVLREISLLSDLFESARREWRWIEQNPMRDMRKPKKPKHRETVITRPQIKRILRNLGYAKGKVRTVSQAAACCFLLALRTGMRAGELCRLEWRFVFDGYCRLPKTKNGNVRDVPLTPKATEIIDQMRGFDADLVFGLKAQTLDAFFRRARDKAKMEGFTFHDSRHTAATWISGRMKSTNIPVQQAVFDLCKMFGWTKLDQALVYYNASAADIAKRIT